MPNAASNDIVIDALRPDRAEALRYLRLPAGAKPPAELAARLDTAEAELLAAAVPRFVWRRFAIDRTPKGVLLRDTAVTLPGADIAALLADSPGCLLLAATLGQTADDLIRRAETVDISRALLLDALASAAVENLCDQLQAALARHFAAEKLFLTRRFSPGYGDLPLALQRPLCRLLDAGRLIGLTVSRSDLLLPRKSVTAVIGLSPRPPRHANDAGDKCAVCPSRSFCPYSQSGGCNK